MKDINEIMPKVPNMKWGALLNKKPSSKKIEDLITSFHIMENGIPSLKKKMLHILTAFLFLRRIKISGLKLILWYTSSKFFRDFNF